MIKSLEVCSTFTKPHGLALAPGRFFKPTHIQKLTGLALALGRFFKRLDAHSRRLRDLLRGGS